MNAQNTFENLQVNIRLKLAALWTSFMFLYIYVDYFALYMPGKLDGIKQGKVFVFDIDQRFLALALVSVSIPAIMIFLSLMTPSKLNRWINLFIAVIYIPYSLFNLMGETWLHMYIGAFIEVVILWVIISLTWSRKRFDQKFDS